MDKNNNSIIKGEIDVKSQIMRALSKWRVLLLLGLIFACLMGIYSYTSQKAAVQKWNDTHKTNSGKESASQLDYSNVKTRVLNAINEKRSYFDNSILMKIDSSEYGRASVSLYVTTRELEKEKETQAASVGESHAEVVEESSENTDSEDSGRNSGVVTSEAVETAISLLDNYSNFVTRGMLYDQDILDKFDTSSQYLRELISVSADRDLLKLSIVVCYTDVEGADILLDYIMQKVVDYQEIATKEFGKHEISLKNRCHWISADNSGLFSSIVATKTSEINALMKQYSDLETNREKIESTGASGDAKEAKKPVIKKSNILKMGVIGFILGIVLGIAVYLPFLSLSSKVLSARDFNQLFGLRKLGVVAGANDKQLKGIDKAILSSELRYQSNPEREKCFEIINDNVKSLVGENKSVALVSDLGIEELEQFVKELSKSADSIKYCIAGKLQEPRERKSFDESNAAVIVGGVMKSHYNIVKDLLQEMNNSGKTIIGSIVL